MGKGGLPLGVVKLLGCRCRCGHEWLPRERGADGTFERPSVCPSCKSPRWDKPKLYEKGAR
jgi:predicted Zn-ribbon and HTH transcriptional regulator